MLCPLYRIKTKESPASKCRKCHNEGHATENSLQCPEHKSKKEVITELALKKCRRCHKEGHASEYSIQCSEHFSKIQAEEKVNTPKTKELTIRKCRKCHNEGHASENSIQCPEHLSKKTDKINTKVC
jgi:hypothetical protein